MNEPKWYDGTKEVPGDGRLVLVCGDRADDIAIARYDGKTLNPENSLTTVYGWTAKDGLGVGFYVRWWTELPPSPTSRPVRQVKDFSKMP